MTKLFIYLFTATLVSVSQASQETLDSFVFVEGGTFQNPKSNFHGKDVTLSSFYIGKHEVTQREWVDVMGSNPSGFNGDDLPVEMVTWYDCIEYCNKRSIKEGLAPYYNIDKNAKDAANGNDLDDIKWTVTINPEANGYRLPTEAEWEYAAGGGQLSKGYAYSGSEEIDKVAWYWRNSGDDYLPGGWNWPLIESNNAKTQPVGGKEPNELGIYDMSGNVREWCWDWHGDLETEGADPKGSQRGSARTWKGGGWLGGDFVCEPSFRAGFEANSMGYDQGFRVCRGK